MDQYGAWRLEGSAAEIVLDALHARGAFADTSTDARLDEYPFTYKPF